LSKAVHGMTLVTRNVGHFRHMGAIVVNRWEV